MEEPDYILLSRAQRYCPHSADYLKLRARQGKLKAIKMGRFWVTKKEWVQEYLQKMEDRKKERKQWKVQVLREPKEKAPPFSIGTDPDPITRVPIPTLRSRLRLPGLEKLNIPLSHLSLIGLILIFLISMLLGQGKSGIFQSERFIDITLQRIVLVPQIIQENAPFWGQAIRATAFEFPQRTKTSLLELRDFVKEITPLFK